MRDYINIETTPIDEPCAQLGTEDYAKNSRLECAAFKAQLIRVFGDPPGGASITVGSNPHDFGTYLDLRLNFDDSKEDETDWAYGIESETPYEWDEEAKKFLQEQGYKLPE